ncbi:type I methionyl aminopeptidase [bacterium]|nr:type I methionyl aminopeptidase [bacterium]
MDSNRIVLKSADEIERMRRSGAVLAEVMELIVAHVAPGVRTIELDAIARRELERRGAKAAFLGMYGFPAALCVSVNEQIVHGFPSQRELVAGDIVSLDCGALIDDFYSDMARTVPVGKVDATSEKLIDVTRRALAAGTEQLKPGLRLGDTGAAIQQLVEDEGFSVVRDYTGHGIGRHLHEEPKVLNYGRAGRGTRWQAGMVVCVEPMVNVGTEKTRTLGDKWTVVTADGKRSAHMEDTIAITAAGPLVLTKC